MKDAQTALSEIEAALGSAIDCIDAIAPRSAQSWVEDALALLPTLRAALTPPVDADTEELHRAVWDVIRANSDAIAEECNEEWGEMCAIAADLSDDCDPNLARKAVVEAVAAVNALPGLLAVKAERDRLRAVPEYPVVVEVHMPNSEHDLDKSICEWAEVTPGAKFYCRLSSWRPEWKYVGIEFEAHSEAITFAQRHHPPTAGAFLKAQTFCQVVIKGWDERARAVLGEKT